jgi:hypothetical protein
MSLSRDVNKSIEIQTNRDGPFKFNRIETLD